MRGYKVVKKAGNRYWSAVYDKTLARTEYLINLPIFRKAGLGPYGVFTSKAYAMKYLATLISSIPRVIVACEYVPSEDRCFWNGGRVSYHCPDGTDFADEVMLLKE